MSDESFFWLVIGLVALCVSIWLHVAMGDGRCPKCGCNICDDARGGTGRCVRCGTWYPQRWS